MNKATSSSAKFIIASANVVNNDNVVFSVEIENGIAKQDTVAKTCIQIEVEELQNFFNKNSEIKEKSVKKYILLVDEYEDQITNIQNSHTSKYLY